MAHVIAEPCVGDGGCAAMCPLDCIHPTPGERLFQKVEKLNIDPETCIDCGLCADECPHGAIFPEDKLPAEWAHFKQRNAEYFAKRARGN